MFDPQINNKTIHQMKNQSLKKNQFSFEVISYQFALFFCPKNKQDSRNKKISINWKKILRTQGYYKDWAYWTHNSKIVRTCLTKAKTY